MSKTNEQAFEESIEESLTSHGGYVKGLADSYKKELAMKRCQTLSKSLTK